MGRRRLVWARAVLTTLLCAATAVADRVTVDPATGAQTGDVASCHLYKLSPARRIERELGEIGIRLDDTAPLSVDDLNRVDLMHYEGSTGTDVFLSLLKADMPHHVLDVGSGFGGPARYIAAAEREVIYQGTTGVQPHVYVTAVEGVEEIHSLAAALTARVPAAVRERVKHVGSFVEDLELRTAHTAAHAVLSLLHSPDLARTLGSIRQHMQEGAVLYIEDFFERQPLGTADIADYEDVVGGHASQLPTREGWTALLTDAGFMVDERTFEDTTAKWAPFTRKRAVAYAEQMARHTRVHGGEVARSMLTFYAKMARLLAADALGGCRIVAMAGTGDSWAHQRADT